MLRVGLRGFKSRETCSPAGAGVASDLPSLGGPFSRRLQILLSHSSGFAGTGSRVHCPRVSAGALVGYDRRRSQFRFEEAPGPKPTSQGWLAASPDQAISRTFGGRSKRAEFRPDPLFRRNAPPKEELDSHLSGRGLWVNSGRPFAPNECPLRVTAARQDDGVRHPLGRACNLSISSGTVRGFR
jgi:hypothetical protein